MSYSKTTEVQEAEEDTVRGGGSYAEKIQHPLCEYEEMGGLRKG